jgi:curved DNA-binding protein CbpA
MADRITWYDILGISPGSSSESVRRAYQDKVTQLEHDRIADAPPEVAAAATRGREVLDAAWLVLGNRAERQRYDEQIGISGKAAGLNRTESAPSRPGLPDTALAVLDPGDVLLGGLDPGDVLGGLGAALAGLGALAAWLAPLPRKSRRQSQEVIVPDVRGLFASACLGVLAKAGFRTSTVRLTEHPMPVDGLIVGQSPAPGGQVPRSSTLTVHVWHPPRPQPREQ